MFRSLLKRTNTEWLRQAKCCLFVFTLFYVFINDGRADYFEFVLDASTHHGQKNGRWDESIGVNSWDQSENWAINANGWRFKIKGFSFAQPVLVGRANFDARSVFQEGINTFSAIFNGNNLSGVSFRVLYWNDQNQARMICSGSLKNETQNLVDCGNVRMSLIEVDPHLIEEIERYKREHQGHRQRAMQPSPEELEANEHERRYEAERVEIERKIQALNQELSALNFGDFDSIQLEQMSQLISEDSSIRQLYTEFKASVDHLREEIQQEVATNEEKTRQVEAELKRLFGEAIAEQRGFDGPIREVPPAADEGPAFQGEAFGAEDANPDLHPQLDVIANQSIHNLEAALAHGDQAAFLGAFASWKTYQKNAKNVLEKHPNSGPKLDELRRNQERVLRFVERHIDLYGFFNTARVPEQIKRVIRTQIRDWNKEVAQDLRDELNQWQGELNPTQVRVLNQIAELGNALGRLSGLRLQEKREDPVQEEARNIVQTALSVSAEQLVQAARRAPEAKVSEEGGAEKDTLSEADEFLLESQGSLKLALTMGDFLLGVSPVGAVKDLLEAVSGVSLLSQEPLSLHERSFTLVMGTIGLVPGVKLALKVMKGIVAVGKRLQTTLSAVRGARGARAVYRIEEAAVQAERVIESAGRAGALGAEKVVQTFTEKAAEGKNVFSKLLTTAKRTNEKQMEAVLEDGSKVLFRRDVGEHAHALGGAYRGQGPINHYNIEIHVPKADGGFKAKQNYHLILDNEFNVIDFIK